MRLDWRYNGHAIVGDRDSQEDSFSLWPAPTDSNDDNRPDVILLVLSDGMGGHDAGETASRLTVMNFIKSFQRNQGPVRKRLLESIKYANDQICEATKASPELKGMGCTLVAVALVDNLIYWVSIGDSPLWLLRGGRLKRLNEDHSYGALLEEQYRQGKISEEEMLHHPDKNALTSAIMGMKLQQIDCPKEPTTAIAGDCAVVASDGVFTLTLEEMAREAEQFSAQGPAAAASALTAAVLRKHARGQDNTTVVVAQALPQAEPGENWNAFLFGSVGLLVIASSLCLIALLMI